MLTPFCRIGQTDRTIGSSANVPNGFYVLNLSNQKAFTVVAGLWANSVSTIPNYIGITWNLSYSVPGGNSFNFYINTSTGNDANSGTSPSQAWLTTGPADAISLTMGQTIGYFYLGTYLLYRTPGMTMDMTTLPANLITARADQF